jgi:PIN domain nuclease of toxin-antitoxin system
MSRLLLDTHTFLWWINNSPELSAIARQAIKDANNECYLSMASCWELAIKSSIGKIKLAKPVERFVTENLAANNFDLLNIELKHTAKVEKLPFHDHRDPFDRLIISQAILEKMVLVSVDEAFTAYGVKLIW